MSDNSAGRFAGKVAYITGVARGQGRNHALRLAAEGAIIVGCDVATAVSATAYPPATEDDFAETERLLTSAGATFLIRRLDIRDLGAQQQLLADAVAKFGRLDVVIANAGILTWGHVWEMSEQQFDDVVDVNLNGTWRTLRAAIPHMIEAGNGGSIVIVSSAAGLKAMPMQASYSASKHALVGLAQTSAKELGHYKIRVNTVHPYGVDTPMALEDTDANRVFEEMPYYSAHFQPVLNLGIATCDDISDTVLFLASDQAHTMTGATIAVDMGHTKV